jgi:FkbM family methyltransferase
MFNPDQIENVKTIYGSFYSWKDDLITKQLKQHSAHTRNELAMLKSVIHSGDNILDIGAHIGTFSIPFAEFNERKGKVYSFEANSDNYELLNRNITENNLENIIISRQALVSADDRGFAASIPDGGNSGMFYFIPSTESSSDIDIINIDNWHKEHAHDIEISLIKVDVEGAELLVLNSCQQLIQARKPVLYIEINKSHLERFGFSISDIECFLNPFGYHYFRNVGPRNTSNDNFKIARINNVHNGGSYFDLLAIHPSDSRYPKKQLGRILSWYYRKKTRLTKKLKRRFSSS